MIEAVSPEVIDKSALRRIISQDEGFRNKYTDNEEVFKKVMADEEVFLKISPTLFFEILLRRAARDLSATGYTLEKDKTMKIPIFDAQHVSDLLGKSSIAVYLADMLSSFTRIQSYTISFPVKKGIWRKIRFSDLDIHSLMTFCQIADEEYRLGLYKRIADICLFILGIFPDYAERDYRYPFSRELRPHLRGKSRISPEEYEKEGRRFYKLAAEHPSSGKLDLSDAFQILHQDFEKAKKPLSFVAEHYLQYKRQVFF